MLVNYKTGKKKTDKEIKADIMKWTGWTTKEYQKKYDVFRNRVRNYEQTAAGGQTFKVNELFWEVKRSEQKFGKAYKPSALVRSIMATPSAGTGKVKRQGVSKDAQKAQYKAVLKAFKGLRKAYPDAEEIVKTWRNQQRRKDPTKRPTVAELKNALAQWAEDVHGWNRKKNGEWEKQHPDAPAGRKSGTPA